MKDQLNGVLSHFEGGTVKRKTRNTDIQKDVTKATFLIDVKLFKKMKYLSFDSGRSLTDLYHEAITDLLKKSAKK